LESAEADGLGSDWRHGEITTMANHRMRDTKSYFKSIALNCETTITILGLQQEGELVEVSFSWKRPLIVRQLNGNGGCATAEGGEVLNSYEVNPASMLVWPVRIQVRY